MQVLQNKTVRLLCNYVKYVNDTASYFKNLRVLNVGQIRDCEAAVFAYRCWNDLCPTVFLIFSLHKSSVPQVCD